MSLKTIRLRNLILKYFLLFFLCVSVYLNMQVYVSGVWKTPSFFMAYTIELLQELFPYFMKKIKNNWTIFWISFFVFLGIIYSGLKYIKLITKHLIFVERKNLILRYFGLFFIMVGTILNLRMLISNTWPTYLFFVLCGVGLIQTAISLLIKQIKISWQLFYALIPFILGYTYLNII